VQIGHDFVTLTSFDGHWGDLLREWNYTTSDDLLVVNRLPSQGSPAVNWTYVIDLIKWHIFDSLFAFIGFVIHVIIYYSNIFYNTKSFTIDLRMSSY